MRNDEAMELKRLSKAERLRSLFQSGDTERKHRRLLPCHPLEITLNKALSGINFVSGVKQTNVSKYETRYHCHRRCFRRILLPKCPSFCSKNLRGSNQVIF